MELPGRKIVEVHERDINHKGVMRMSIKYFAGGESRDLFHFPPFNPIIRNEFLTIWIYLYKQHLCSKRYTYCLFAFAFHKFIGSILFNSLKYM